MNSHDEQRRGWPCAELGGESFRLVVIGLCLCCSGLAQTLPQNPSPAPAVTAAPAPAATPTPAATSPNDNRNGTNTPAPVVMVIVLGALGLAPFVLIMLTSFVKLAVVLSILRNALGTQQTPPNQVITGLAFILTIFIMSPVAQQMYAAAGPIPDTGELFSAGNITQLWNAARRSREPLRQFLLRHAHEPDRVMFLELQARLTAGSQVAAAGPVAPVDRQDFRVLIPAFVTSELKEAFQTGFLIYIPFLIIDLVVANILLTMGMGMLSPPVVSLPFKLLVFVLVDGWALIVRGLVLSYV